MGSWQRTRVGRVAVLSFARPPVNALDRAALEELEANVREVEADADVRALVVTGGLDGLFCAGGDLRDRDVAGALGVSMGTAKIRLHRARATLRKEMERRGEFYRDGTNRLACDRKCPS